MLTKANSSVYEKLPYASMRPCLSMAEKSLLKWAVIDRDDKVLDAGLGNGCMVEYLKRNMECEVCGVSDNMELVRQTRNLVRSADLVYALDGDIPWRDRAFDTVLMRSKHGKTEDVKRQLTEIHRVLKDGGQLVMGVECWPGLMKRLNRVFGDQDVQDEAAASRKETEEQLKALGFNHLSWQRANLLKSVLIAWKRNPVEETAKKEVESMTE